MQLLLKHGADPTLAPTRSGINALMAAAGLGTTEQDTTGRDKTQPEAIAAIELLLDQGLDVNTTATDGRTALHGAAMQGYDEVITFLAAQGAKLDVQDKDGFQPLDVALGKAGGFGFSGDEGVVRESTAALLRNLMSAAGATQAAAAPR
jgi:ankyrin repeat protein